MATVCREFLQGVWLGCRILIPTVATLATLAILH